MQREDGSVLVSHTAAVKDWAWNPIYCGSAYPQVKGSYFNLSGGTDDGAHIHIRTQTFVVWIDDALKKG